MRHSHFVQLTPRQSARPQHGTNAVLRPGPLRCKIVVMAPARDTPGSAADQMLLRPVHTGERKATGSLQLKRRQWFPPRQTKTRRQIELLAACLIVLAAANAPATKSNCTCTLRPLLENHRPTVQR